MKLPREVFNDIFKNFVDDKGFLKEIKVDKQLVLKCNSFLAHIRASTLKWTWLPWNPIRDCSSPEPPEPTEPPNEEQAEDDEEKDQEQIDEQEVFDEIKRNQNTTLKHILENANFESALKKKKKKARVENTSKAKFLQVFFIFNI